MNNFYKLRQPITKWGISSLVLTIVLLSPIIMIILQLFSPPNENWYHIQEFLLKNYISNTLFIVVFTALSTAFLGLSSAWLLVYYDFPFRKFFKWALILPLSIPPYIGAFTYHGIMNYTGIIQTTLRNEFGMIVNQKYFDIMNIPGAIFIFTMFLYPYVFIITSSYLQRQSASLIENARLLGSSSFEIFFRIIVPISRAAIIGGVSLVSLEVLNDYGVVKYYGIQTFSTAIFQTWFGMADLPSAVKLAGILMVFVIFFIGIEKFSRGRKKYSFSTTKVRPIQPRPLSPLKRNLVLLYFFIIFSLSFLIPFIQLFQWMLMTVTEVVNIEFFTLAWNSIMVAVIASFFIILIALVIANFTRLTDGVFSKLISKLSMLGYSVPGAVLSIGVLTLFITLDYWLANFYRIVGYERTLVLSLSVIMLICAYIIRFLAIGYNSIEAGFERVGRSYTEASRTLGMGLMETFFKVDIPLIKGAIIGGFILVFVDIMKELTLTLILQPFNFYTLATKAYQYASDEMIHEASLPSLIIITISGLSIYMFHRISERSPN